MVVRDDLWAEGFCGIPAVFCLAHSHFICRSAKEPVLFIGWDLISNNAVKFCADKSSPAVYSSLEHNEQRKIPESISPYRHPVARTFMEMA